MTTVVVLSGIVSTALAIAGGLPFVRSILNGRTKPHQFSWLVYTIMKGIVTISQFLAGGRASVLISLTFFVQSIICFGLSLRYGIRSSSRYDRMLLGLSLVTIVIWVAAKSNDAAIWLTVVIDIFATAMIILKVRADPSSEDPTPWLIGAIAYVFSCITLAHVRVGILYVRPIYGLITDAAIVTAILYGTRRARVQPGTIH